MRMRSFLKEPGSLSARRDFTPSPPLIDVWFNLTWQPWTLERRDGDSTAKGCLARPPLGRGLVQWCGHVCSYISVTDLSTRVPAASSRTPLTERLPESRDSLSDSSSLGLGESDGTPEPRYSSQVSQERLRSRLVGPCQFGLSIFGPSPASLSLGCDRGLSCGNVGTRCWYRFCQVERTRAAQGSSGLPPLRWPLLTLRRVTRLHSLQAFPGVLMRALQLGSSEAISTSVKVARHSPVEVTAHLSAAQRTRTHGTRLETPALRAPLGRKQLVGRVCEDRSERVGVSKPRLAVSRPRPFD
ncbi:hypothetical protein MHYP_G00252060 [Metynnis hypsauchen]